MSCMLPSVRPPPPTPRLPDFLQNVYSTITPRPDLGSMLQSTLPAMTSRPELNLYGLGLPPTVYTTTGQGQLVTNWISGNMSEQERLMLSAMDLNFNSRGLNADQFASLPPFSINPSRIEKSVPQMPQHTGFIDRKSGTYLGGSSATKAVPYEALKLKQSKTEPDDAGRGKRIGHVSYGGWPSSQDSMSYSMEKSVGKQIVTNFGSYAAGDDGVHGKDLQRSKIATDGDPLDVYVKSFLLDEEAPDEMSPTFCTSPGNSLS